MEAKTKVEAIAELIEANGGKANWTQIYQKIGRYYRGAKASAEWQAGLRGVVYREIRNGRTFKKVADATFALK